ncbi:MAG TPA: ATP-binding protein, partial [Iamia sp.]|nr:ATP-binding protein [Iamia sp.]
AELSTILHALEDLGALSAEGIEPDEELAALRELRRLKDAVSISLSYFVAHARAVGKTWSEIGDALGTSAQNAQKNYRRVLTTNLDEVVEQRAAREPSRAANDDGATPEDPTLGGLKRSVVEAIVDAHVTEKDVRPWGVLLQGPPGTGKTSLVVEIAKRLDWPLVTISPADLLSEGIEKVPSRLSALSSTWVAPPCKVVHLVDMGDFLAERGTSSMTTSLFVTALLPVLKDLHDSGQALVVVETSASLREVDPAVMRLGRIDLVVSLDVAPAGPREPWFPNLDVHGSVVVANAAHPFARAPLPTS